LPSVSDPALKKTIASEAEASIRNLAEAAPIAPRESIDGLSKIANAALATDQVDLARTAVQSLDAVSSHNATPQVTEQVRLALESLSKTALERKHVDLAVAAQAAGVNAAIQGAEKSPGSDAAAQVRAADQTLTNLQKYYEATHQENQLNSVNAEKQAIQEIERVPANKPFSNPAKLRVK
jgi:N-acetyl-gamma-glutamylphosphate reductase